MKSRADLVLENIEMEKLVLKYKKALYDLAVLHYMLPPYEVAPVELRQEKSAIAWKQAKEVLGL